jgi:hypothetical protein
VRDRFARRWEAERRRLVAQPVLRSKLSEQIGRVIDTRGRRVRQREIDERLAGGAKTLERLVQAVGAAIGRNSMREDN